MLYNTFHKPCTGNNHITGHKVGLGIVLFDSEGGSDSSFSAGQTGVQGLTRKKCAMISWVVLPPRHAMAVCTGSCHSHPSHLTWQMTGPMLANRATGEQLPFDRRQQLVCGCPRQPWHWGCQGQKNYDSRAPKA